MNKRILVSCLALGLTAVAASPALALPLVAGWDFSQYFADGALSTDGSTLTNTLHSNYSDLDPSFGAGAQSAAFGTMHLDGQFGSTSTPLDFSDPFVPSAAAGGSLGSNHTPGAGVPFDSYAVLTTEGQTFANPLVMTALSAASVVFEADLTSVPQTGSSWTLTFAGKTSTGTAVVQVQLSLDGVNFSVAQQANLTTNDTPFTFSFASGSSEKAYARLAFSNPATGQNTFLDNVSFGANLTTVPEPATSALLVTGLAGLALAGRRRT